MDQVLDQLCQLIDGRTEVPVSDLRRVIEFAKREVQLQPVATVTNQNNTDTACKFFVQHEYVSVAW